MKLLKLAIVLSIFTIEALSQNEIIELKTLIDARNYTKAYFKANELLKKDSSDARLYFFKAEALHGTNKNSNSPILLGEAMKLYAKAIELDSLYFEPYFALGELRYDLLKENEKRISTNNLDDLSVKLGKIALFYFNKAKIIKPDDELVKERLLELEKHLEK